MQFDARASIRASEGKPPTLAILAYGGGVMNVPGWGDVVIDLAGMEAAGQIPILIDHENNIDAVAGYGEASVQSYKLFVAGPLAAATAAGRKVLELHRTGFQFQASVGVQRKTQPTPIAPGQTIHVNGRTLTAGARGLLLVSSSKLREVSICSMGCDADTSVAIAAKQKANSPMAKKPARKPRTQATAFDEDDAQVDLMAESLLSGSPIQASHEPLPSDPLQAQRELAARESDRISGVRRIIAAAASGRQLTIEVDGEQTDLEGHAIRAGWGLAETELAAMKAALPVGGPAIHAVPQGASGLQHIEAALLVRAGKTDVAEKVLGERVMTQSRHLHGASMMDLLRAALVFDGRQVPSGREEMIRAALTTGSMPVALGNTVNKAMLAAYQEGRATWQSFCAVRPAADFKPHTSIRPTHMGGLEELGEGGQIEHGSFGEATIQWSISTFAKRFTYSRHDIVNDDLGIISETGPALGRMGLRKVADLVYETLFANAGNFFHANNKNLLAGGGGVNSILGVDPLIAALTKMRTQRDKQNNDLDIQPAVLLVSPENEGAGKTALESEFVERAVNEATGNPVRKAVKLEIESRLSNTEKFATADKDHWYLFGGPSDVPMIVGFLDGKTSPTVEFFGLDHDVRTLAVTWRVYFDFGAALGDFRAAVKADGVAAA